MNITPYTEKLNKYMRVFKYGSTIAHYNTYTYIFYAIFGVIGVRLYKSININNL